MAAAARNSSAKSRSETASSELGRRPVEAQGFCGHRAIDRERRAGERARAQRRFIETPARIGEPSTVAAQHFDIGEEVMSEGDGLADLQMGEAGHDRGGMALGLLDQSGPAQRPPVSRSKPVDRVAHPEAKIGRDLVVARARGVEPPGAGPDQFGEPRPRC